MSPHSTQGPGLLKDISKLSKDSDTSGFITGLRLALSPIEVYLAVHGLSVFTAPRVFTSVGEAISALFNTWSFHIHGYLDDWPLRSQSFSITVDRNANSGASQVSISC